MGGVESNTAPMGQNSLASVEDKKVEAEESSVCRSKTEEKKRKPRDDSQEGVRKRLELVEKKRLALLAKIKEPEKVEGKDTRSKTKAEEPKIVKQEESKEVDPKLGVVTVEPKRVDVFQAT